jgi:hypothetical protein
MSPHVNWPEYRPLSHEEHDYIDALPEQYKNQSVLELQQHNTERMEDFLNFLRCRTQGKVG